MNKKTDPSEFDYKDKDFVITVDKSNEVIYRYGAK